MKTLNAPDTISGKEGRAYAKVNGNNEELFMSKTIEATGGNGTGSMTLYYLTPLFRNMVKTWKETGQDIYFDMVVENDDQESSAGKQSVLLIGCNLDSVVLAKLDGDSDDPLDEDVDFTFEDFDILTPFTKF